MTWYNDTQLEKVAHDIYEVHSCETEAVIGDDLPSWENLIDEKRAIYRARAKAELDSLIPLDISKPIQMRNGMPVENPRHSEDGLRIVVDVPAWGSRPASWGISGREVDHVTTPHPHDLVHAPAAA